jgi:hypothetical protein
MSRTPIELQDCRIAGLQNCRIEGVLAVPAKETGPNSKV